MKQAAISDPVSSFGFASKWVWPITFGASEMQDWCRELVRVLFRHDPQKMSQLKPFLDEIRKLANEVLPRGVTACEEEIDRTTGDRNQATMRSVHIARRRALRLGLITIATRRMSERVNVLETSESGEYFAINRTFWPPCGRPRKSDKETSDEVTRPRS